MRSLLIGISVVAGLTLVPVIASALQGDVDTQPQSSCVDLHNNLRYRSTDAQTGGEVSLLQSFLQDNNFLNSDPTGFFGRQTLQAVKTFQGSVGLDQTGFVGPLTRGKIKYATCGDGMAQDIVSSASPTSDHKVSTIFFDLFFGQDGLFQSPWTPPGGWAAIDSRKPEWATQQIKDMMSANIDIVYHSPEGYMGDPTYNQFDGYADKLLAALQNFLKSYRALVEAGYVPPKIAMWANNEQYQWSQCEVYKGTQLEHLDVSTRVGEDFYYNTMIKPFWTNYFSIMGPYADANLAKENGKVMISLDYFYPRCLTGLSNQFLLNLKSRFKKEFGYDVYLLGNPENSTDPNLPSFDETHNAFGTTNFWYGGKDADGNKVIEVLPGVWTPTNHTVLRNAGAMYKDNWTQALALKSRVKHLGITSWNYYGEGSQISESDTVVNPDAGYPDTWSNPPDPRYYIKQTGLYAAQWSDLPGNDASFVSQSVPANMVAGQSYPISVTFRNAGNKAWSASGNYKLGLVNAIPGVPSTQVLSDSQDEIPTFGGIFRGRPKTFTFNITAPATPGTYNFQWRMIQQNVGWFGDTSPVVKVNVTSSLDTVINGSCGSSNGGTFSSPLTTNLCSAGTASSVTTGASSYAWTCAGSGGGTTMSCSATITPASVSGVCSQTHYYCSAGTSANQVDGSTSWTWACNGSGGGTNAQCTEMKAPVTSLIYTGTLRDKVSTGKNMDSDGTLDSTFLVTFNSGTKTVTGITLTKTNGDGGFWNTGSAGGWVIGVANSLDGRSLLNAADTSISLPVSNGSQFYLFVSPPPAPAAGDNFVLTVSFSDGTQAKASITVAKLNQSANALNAFNSAVTTYAPALKYNYTWTRDLQIGSPYTDDVKALQTVMTMENVYRGDITGGFYSQTFSAVQAFQMKYGINATGYVGPLTRAKLNALY